MLIKLLSHGETIGTPHDPPLENPLPDAGVQSLGSEDKNKEPPKDPMDPVVQIDSLMSKLAMHVSSICINILRFVTKVPSEILSWFLTTKFPPKGGVPCPPHPLGLDSLSPLLRQSLL